MFGRLISQLGVAFMRFVALLPLPSVRAMGAVLGWLLYALVWPRRRVAMRNLTLCFKEQSNAVNIGHCRKSFTFFAQTWLDRGWLWHGRPAMLGNRLRLVGAVHELTGNTAPVVIFAPHFYGLDAGWTALTQLVDRHFVTIYAQQSNAVVDAWILQGRQRFGQPGVISKGDGVLPVVAAIKRSEPLYLLPDMDYGADGAVFAPFFGTPAATVSSLSRFARLARAKVVPVTTRLTDFGYEVTVHPAWRDFPTSDLQRDTERMNRELEALILRQPAEYYWVHKRFKTRPEGEKSLYD